MNMTHRALLQCIIESARVLGIAQEQNDEDKEEYFQHKLDEFEEEMKARFNMLEGDGRTNLYAVYHWHDHPTGPDYIVWDFIGDKALAEERAEANNKTISKFGAPESYFVIPLYHAHITYPTRSEG
jgi:hypothetical protein